MCKQKLLSNDLKTKIKTRTEDVLHTATRSHRAFLPLMLNWNPACPTDGRCCHGEVIRRRPQIIPADHARPLTSDRWPTDGSTAIPEVRHSKLIEHDTVNLLPIRPSVPVRPSVRPSARPSVRPFLRPSCPVRSVRPYVRPSICPSVRMSVPSVRSVRPVRPSHPFVRSSRSSVRPSVRPSRPFR